MEQIVIEFEYNSEIMKEAFRSNLTRARFRWRLWVWIFVVIAFGYFVTSFDFRNMRFSALNIQTVGPIVIGLLIYLGYLFWFAPQRWANTLLKQENFRGTMKWIITEKIIRIIIPNGSSEVQWEFFKKAVFSKGIVLLFSNPSLMYIIPLSAFKENDLSQFKTWVRQNIKEVKE